MKSGKSMENKSKIVFSNQSGVHQNLEAVVRKHLDSVFQKPIAMHTRQAFKVVSNRLEEVSGRSLILDACCGVGDSTRQLARMFPDHWVIGVDKSESRIMRERPGGMADNLILMRADLNDFYRLAVEARWALDRHYILYPNPWPKSVHFKRRWHGSAIFPFMLELGGRLEIRSNWSLYLEEFAAALRVAGYDSQTGPFAVAEPITAFEAKYSRSGQQLYRLTANLTERNELRA